MPIEIKGNQLRIRMKDLNLFMRESYRTQDVGSKGKLQRVAGRHKRTGKWVTQSWRLNLKDYNTFTAVKSEIRKLKTVSPAKKKTAIKVASRWWTTNRGGI